MLKPHEKSKITFYPISYMDFNILNFQDDDCDADSICFY